VFIPFPGASSEQVESLVASPMEKVLGEIESVKHIYSVSRPGIAVLTVQFEVGEDRTEAIVRLYNAIYSNQDWRPPGLGVQQPLVKPGSIDDVPILSLTLWTRDQAVGAWDLGKVARSIETEIKRVPGTRDVETIGDPDNVVHVQLDAARLAGHGLTVAEIANALSSSNLVQHAGQLVGSGRVTPVQVGEFLADRNAVANLVVGVHAGKPIYLEDVATIANAPDQPESYVWFATGVAAEAIGADPVAYSPAVTLAVSKKPGQNASDVATHVLERIELLRGTYIPDGVQVTVTRNYGQTANDKAQKLIQKLLFATASVVLLVVLTMGGREAIVIGTAVVVTLAATLFASWAWGFTINRVSLFALIFSIGILVDDAIVVVENIHRHNQLGRGTLTAIIPRAVDEVGGPTILATFTVIAALLPMAFVSGLMGPYMSPIPINSSMGMLISLAIALIFTPWMCRKLLANRPVSATEHGVETAAAGRMTRLFERTVRPFLAGPGGRARRHKLYWAILAAIVLASGLAAVKLVVMKMLPFDNKSEFQVVLNMPEGTPVETTAKALDDLASVIRKVPEVTDYQLYAGTAAPINFNGLVRQYYLRQAPEFGDIQVNLLDKHHRDRKSHDIALSVRDDLAAIGKRYNAAVQVVEVPPGPPVLAPIVAEVYGSRYSEQQQLARQLRKRFDSTQDIVDVDDSLEAASPRFILLVDQQKAALLGISQAQVAQLLTTALSGTDATYVHTGSEREPIAVRMELPVANKAQIDDLLQLKVRSASGTEVPVGEVVRVKEATWDGAIYHKDLLPVVYVTGDMAGPLDSPLYGMFDLVGQLQDLPVTQHFIAPPDDPNELAVKWDGEWQITYETFRDMGLAYAVGLVLIYLLVAAHFGSYAVPLIIMAPIPLTIIGVMPGHALLRAQFTATSMIGMIALAGIIVRNSILLVDFIKSEIAAGGALEDAVVRAGAIRAKPIILTGLAAMIGAFFILDDPIFNGLAVALIFGIFVSTLLTLVVIPILYYAYLMRRPHAATVT